jgi:outer membrane protein assembly factor BamB
MYDRRAGVRRIWIPVAVVLLATASIFGLWYWPNPDFGYDYRSAGSYLAVIAGVLGVVGWWLLLSGIGWLRRFAIFAVVAVLLTGAVWGAVDRVEFQGNMVPIVRWRWERHDRGPREAGGLAVIPADTSSDDFPEYRNHNRDGVITGLSLDRGWAIHPPKKLWGLSLGEEAGFGGISVVGPSAVTIEQVGDDEVVACYDADTGHERWNYRYRARFSEVMGGVGPRTNPTIAGGDVYTLGATGHLARLDGRTGKPKWQADTLDKRWNVYWGQSGSPLVYDRFVVVNPGRNREKMEKDSAPGTGPSVVAYDRETGTIAWRAGENPAGYSSPQLATIAGVRQVLVFDAAGLGSYDPETGKDLWSFPWTQDPEVNVAQPLVFDGGRVFISSGYGHGSAMLKVTVADGKWSVANEPLWTTPKLKSKFANPVAYKGHIYGLDESAGSLTCLDAANGKVCWKDGRYGNGQILLVGDLILIESETGKLVLVEANPEHWNEVASFQALEGRKNWNYLTVAHGRAYLRNHEMMACFELPVGKK